MKRFACFVIALFATIWALRAQQTIVTYTPDGVKTYDTAEPPSELLDTTQFVVSYRMLYRQRPENEHPMEDLLLLQIGRNVTKFYSYKTWQTDSLVRVTPPEQVLANLGSFHGGVQDVLFQVEGGNRMPLSDGLHDVYHVLGVIMSRQKIENRRGKQQQHRDAHDKVRQHFPQQTPSFHGSVHLYTVPYTFLMQSRAPASASLDFRFLMCV